MSASEVTRTPDVSTPDRAPTTAISTVAAWARRHLAWLLVVPVASVYAAAAIGRFERYIDAGYDLGLFDQMVRSYAHFRPPYAPIVGPDFNMLGDHFSPIMALLAPLYWIWADPRMLIVAQAVLVATSLVPVFRFTERRLGATWAPWIALGYAFAWPLQSMVTSHVHEVMFAVPLIAWAIDAIDRRADRALLLTCVLLVLVKEDMGVVVVMLGVVRAVVGGRGQRRTGAVVAALGVAGYVVAIMLVIPSLSQSAGVTHWSYDSLGPDLPSAVVAMLTHPVHATSLFFWSPPIKAATLVLLFLPVLFLCFRSPLALVALPLLAERFFSSQVFMWGPYFHYSATVWPILLLAAVDGAHRMRVGGRHREMPRMLGITLLAFAVGGTAFVGNLYPLHRLLDGSAFAISAHTHDKAAIVAAVPPNTCVEADDFIVPHLLRDHLVSEPGRLGRPADFIVVDRVQPRAGAMSPTSAKVEASAVAAGYDLVLQRGDVVLYRSPTYDGASAACRP